MGFVMTTLLGTIGFTLPVVGVSWMLSAITRHLPEPQATAEDDED